MKQLIMVWVGAAAVMAIACGSEDESRSALSQQAPPMGATELQAWLEKGDYKQWHCESTVHEARSPSPHGYNRICSNNVLSAGAKGTGDWAEGSAAVKEVYESANDSTPKAYAVYIKTKPDSANGANWYWYEGTRDGNVIVDGLGDSGLAKSSCVGCHAAAGTDAAHTPTEGGRDQVYTPVL